MNMKKKTCKEVESIEILKSLNNMEEYQIIYNDA